jgi:hypothetical protein
MPNRLGRGQHGHQPFCSAWRIAVNVAKLPGLLRKPSVNSGNFRGSTTNPKP